MHTFQTIRHALFPVNVSTGQQRRRRSLILMAWPVAGYAVSVGLAYVCAPLFSLPHPAASVANVLIGVPIFLTGIVSITLGVVSFMVGLAFFVAEVFRKEEHAKN